MAVIVRRFDGDDLIISAVDLKKMGLRAGQFVAIRPMQPLPLMELRIQTEEDRARRRDLSTLWGRTTVGEEIDAECEHEESWERWSQGT